MSYLRILKNSFLVVHQASVPHQCRHRPRVGLQIDPGRRICQEVDGEADRLDTTYGTDAARPYLRAAWGSDVLGQLDNAAILVIDLKDRITFEGADSGVVSSIGGSPVSVTCYQQPAAVLRSAAGYSAIDHVLQFLTERSVRGLALGGGQDPRHFRHLAALDGTGTGCGRWIIARGIYQAIHDHVHNAVTIHITFKNDLSVGNGNQADGHGRVHCYGRTGVVCRTVISDSCGTDHAAVGIPRLMQVAFKLINELASFLGQVNLGLLCLTALGGEVDPIENGSQHDRQNSAHDDQLDQREDLLRGKRCLSGYLHDVHINER